MLSIDNECTTLFKNDLCSFDVLKQLVELWVLFIGFSISLSCHLLSCCSDLCSGRFAAAASVQCAPLVPNRMISTPASAAALIQMAARCQNRGRDLPWRSPAFGYSMYSSW